MKRKLLSVLLVLVLALSLCLVMAVPVAAQDPATIEVSQPVQVTSDSHYERGQSIVYDGENYWLFYGRSESCEGWYQSGDPDTHDYEVYYKKAASVADLAVATPTLIPGASNQNGYLGETGAAYVDGNVWAFATIDVGATADLYGWYTDDSGSTWSEVGPLAVGLSDGAAHHDEIGFDGKLFVMVNNPDALSGWYTKNTDDPTASTITWSEYVPLDDPNLVNGLAHFFADGSELYLAINSTLNYIYKYNSGTTAWDKVDEDSPPNMYDPTLFKVADNYVFAQAPWDGTKQYILAWSGATLDSTFFDTTYRMVTEGAYGTNSWVDMWPIGFTDDNGDSYLFFTSERDEPAQEGTGNIWYLEVDWDVTRDHFTYIQEAIDSASENDTVKVAAGIYDETVELKDTTAPGISIVGQDKTTTFITGGICFAADYSGLKVQNFTITGNGFLLTETYEATVSCHWYGHYAVTDLELSDCVFDGENYDAGTDPEDPTIGGRTGVVIKRLGGDVRFTNNVFKNYPGWAAIDVNDGSGEGPLAVTSYTLTGNDFLDNGGSVALRGNPADYTDTVVINGNTSDGAAGWAAIETNYADSVEIYENTIRNAEEFRDWEEGAAIEVWGIGEADIYSNTIEDNYQGILVWNYPAPYDVSNISVHHNSFAGNLHDALWVEEGVTGGPLDATYNWWGSATGPYHATANPGVVANMGDAVSDNVDFSPWLYQPQEEIVPTEKPSYAQSVVLDNTGEYAWNTFSTPIFLDGSADTWIELYDLTGLDYSVAYRFDSAIQDFVPLTTTDESPITPGEGLFIKMNTAGSLPILYSTAENLVPLSRLLTVGFNLIGLAWLEDMDVDDALFSLAGEVQVVSPTGNESPGPVLTGDTVYVGEAYWAYMLGEETLVGFTTTPVNWVP